MKEYQKQLEFYTNNDKKSMIYLDKYWLNEREMEEVWLPIKSTIFNDSFKWFPDKVFNDDFILRPIFSGAVLIREDYQSLMNSIEEIGDNEYVIIQDYDYNNPPKGGIEEIPLPPLYFKFPSSLSWSEISPVSDTFSPEFISKVLFEPVHNYFVFGKSGKWGKYTANDHDDMIDIIGFKPEYLDLFRKYFPISEEEKKDVEEALPEYRNKIVW